MLTAAPHPARSGRAATPNHPSAAGGRPGRRRHPHHALEGEHQMTTSRPGIPGAPGATGAFGVPSGANGTTGVTGVPGVTGATGAARASRAVQVIDARTPGVAR
ncbi:hypothetical protein RKD49_005160 [Streptomyces glaucescens]